MKLRIVEYHNAKERGCKEDIVWYIERVDDYGKVWITCWPVNAKAPYACQGWDARMMYYSYALAKNAFNKIKNWYLTPTHITVIEEEFKPWWRKND